MKMFKFHSSFSVFLVLVIFGSMIITSSSANAQEEAEQELILSFPADVNCSTSTSVMSFVNSTRGLSTTVTTDAASKKLIINKGSKAAFGITFDFSNFTSSASQDSSLVCSTLEIEEATLLFVKVKLSSSSSSSSSVNQKFIELKVRDSNFTNLLLSELSSEQQQIPVLTLPGISIITSKREEEAESSSSSSSSSLNISTTITNTVLDFDASIFPQAKTLRKDFNLALVSIYHQKHQTQQNNNSSSSSSSSLLSVSLTSCKAFLNLTGWETSTRVAGNLRRYSLLHVDVNKTNNNDNNNDDDEKQEFYHFSIASSLLNIIAPSQAHNLSISLFHLEGNSTNENALKGNVTSLLDFNVSVSSSFLNISSYGGREQLRSHLVSLPTFDFSLASPSYYSSSSSSSSSSSLSLYRSRSHFTASVRNNTANIIGTRNESVQAMFFVALDFRDEFLLPPSLLLAANNNKNSILASNNNIFCELILTSTVKGNSIFPHGCSLVAFSRFVGGTFEIEASDNIVKADLQGPRWRPGANIIGVSDNFAIKKYFGLNVTASRNFVELLGVTHSGSIAAEIFHPHSLHSPVSAVEAAAQDGIKIVNSSSSPSISIFTLQSKFILHDNKVSILPGSRTGLYFCFALIVNFWEYLDGGKAAAGSTSLTGKHQSVLVDLSGNHINATCEVRRVHSSTSGFWQAHLYAGRVLDVDNISVSDSTSATSTNGALTSVARVWSVGFLSIYTVTRCKRVSLSNFSITKFQVPRTSQGFFSAFAVSFGNVVSSSLEVTRVRYSGIHATTDNSKMRIEGAVVWVQKPISGTDTKFRVRDVEINDTTIRQLHGTNSAVISIVTTNGINQFGSLEISDIIFQRETTTDINSAYYSWFVCFQNAQGNFNNIVGSFLIHNISADSPSMKAVEGVAAFHVFYSYNGPAGISNNITIRDLNVKVRLDGGNQMIHSIFWIYLSFANTKLFVQNIPLFEAECNGQIGAGEETTHFLWEENAVLHASIFGPNALVDISNVNYSIFAASSLPPPSESSFLSPTNIRASFLSVDSIVGSGGGGTTSNNSKNVCDLSNKVIIRDNSRLFAQGSHEVNVSFVRVARTYSKGASYSSVVSEVCIDISDSNVHVNFLPAPFSTSASVSDSRNQFIFLSVGFVLFSPVQKTLKDFQIDIKSSTVSVTTNESFYYNDSSSASSPATTTTTTTTAPIPVFFNDEKRVAKKQEGDGSEGSSSSSSSSSSLDWRQRVEKVYNPDVSFFFREKLRNCFAVCLAPTLASNDFSPSSINLEDVHVRVFSSASSSSASRSTYTPTTTTTQAVERREASNLESTSTSPYRLMNILSFSMLQFGLLLPFRDKESKIVKIIPTASSSSSSSSNNTEELLSCKVNKCLLSVPSNNWPTLASFVSMTERWNISYSSSISSNFDLFLSYNRINSSALPSSSASSVRNNNYSANSIGPIQASSPLMSLRVFPSSAGTFSNIFGTVNSTFTTYHCNYWSSVFEEEVRPLALRKLLACTPTPTRTVTASKSITKSPPPTRTMSKTRSPPPSKTKTLEKTKTLNLTRTVSPSLSLVPPTTTTTTTTNTSTTTSSTTTLTNTNTTTTSSSFSTSFTTSTQQASNTTTTSLSNSSSSSTTTTNANVSTNNNSTTPTTSQPTATSESNTTSASAPSSTNASLVTSSSSSSSSASTSSNQSTLLPTSTSNNNNTTVIPTTTTSTLINNNNVTNTTSALSSTTTTLLTSTTNISSSSTPTFLTATTNSTQPSDNNSSDNNNNNNDDEAALSSLSASAPPPPEQIVALGSATETASAASLLASGGAASSLIIDAARALTLLRLSSCTVKRTLLVTKVKKTTNNNNNNNNNAQQEDEVEIKAKVQITPLGFPQNLWTGFAVHHVGEEDELGSAPTSPTPSPSSPSSSSSSSSFGNGTSTTPTTTTTTTTSSSYPSSSSSTTSSYVDYETFAKRQKSLTNSSSSSNSPLLFFSNVATSTVFEGAGTFTGAILANIVTMIGISVAALILGSFALRLYPPVWLKLQKAKLVDFRSNDDDDDDNHDGTSSFSALTAFTGWPARIVMLSSFVIDGTISSSSFLLTRHLSNNSAVMIAVSILGLVCFILVAMYAIRKIHKTVNDVTCVPLSGTGDAATRLTARGRPNNPCVFNFMFNSGIGRNLVAGSHAWTQKQSRTNWLRRPTRELLSGSSSTSSSSSSSAKMTTGRKKEILKDYTTLDSEALFLTPAAMEIMPYLKAYRVDDEIQDKGRATVQFGIGSSSSLAMIADERSFFDDEDPAASAVSGNNNNNSDDDLQLPSSPTAAAAGGGGDDDDDDDLDIDLLGDGGGNNSGRRGKNNNESGGTRRGTTSDPNNEDNEPFLKRFERNLRRNFFFVEFFVAIFSSFALGISLYPLDWFNHCVVPSIIILCINCLFFIIVAFLVIRGRGCLCCVPFRTVTTCINATLLVLLGALVLHIVLEQGREEEKGKAAASSSSSSSSSSSVEGRSSSSSSISSERIEAQKQIKSLQAVVAALCAVILGVTILAAFLTMLRGLLWILSSRNHSEAVEELEDEIGLNNGEDIDDDGDGEEDLEDLVSPRRGGGGAGEDGDAEELELIESPSLVSGEESDLL